MKVPRPQFGLRTLLAFVACSAAACWIAHLVRDHNRPVSRLIRALRDDDDKVIMEIAEKLSSAGTEAVANASAEIDREDPLVRRKWIRALGKLGPTAAPAAPAIVRALDDKQAYVRAEAARSLAALRLADGSIDSSSLAKRLNDSNAHVRHSTADALIALGRVGRIGEGGETIIPLLVNALTDSDPIIRDCAARCLGALGPDSALHALLEGLRDDDTWRSAAEALQTIGSRWATVVPELSEALQDEDKDFRFRVAYVLAKLDSKEAVPILIQALEGDSERIVKPLSKSHSFQAIDLLARFGADAADALPALIAMKDHGDSRVRRAVERAIASIEGGESGVHPAR